MKIELVRGDTLKLSFVRKDSENNTILTIPEAIYFTVKTNTNKEEAIFQKTLEDMEKNEITGEYVFYINPEDTNSMNYGTYKYDLEVKDTIDDINYTKTIALGDFVVKEEVTFVSNEV